MLKNLTALAVVFASLSTVPVQASDDKIESVIALQMYTLRNVGTPAQQFAMAHKAGFEHVEIVGTHDLNADQMKALL